MQPKHEVADVLRRVFISDAAFSVQQQKTLRLLHSAAQGPWAVM